jgi:hypothetical protein
MISGDRLDRTPAERTTRGSSDGASTCFANGIVGAETCEVEEVLFLLLPQPPAANAVITIAIKSGRRAIRVVSNTDRLG